MDGKEKQKRRASLTTNDNALKYANRTSKIQQWETRKLSSFENTTRGVGMAQERNKNVGEKNEKLYEFVLVIIKYFRVKLLP